MFYIVLKMYIRGFGNKNGSSIVCTNEQTDRQTEERTDRPTDRRTNRQKNEQTEERTDRRTNRQKNGQTHGQTTLSQFWSYKCFASFYKCLCLATPQNKICLCFNIQKGTKCTVADPGIYERGVRRRWIRPC